VAEQVARQWGVISRAQLRAVGVASATVDYWVRAGRLRVVYRSVYEGIPITTVARTLLDRTPAAPGRAAPAASVLVWCRRTTLRQHDAGTGVTFGARSPTIDHCPG
jgi:hypothetical protein